MLTINFDWIIYKLDDIQGSPDFDDIDEKSPDFDDKNDIHVPRPRLRPMSASGHTLHLQPVHQLSFR